MYDPKYTITDRILNNVVKFEVERNLLLEKELKEGNKKSLEARSKALSLLHVGHMIGVNLTLKDAEKVAEGKRIETEDDRGIILNNYRNVHEFIRSNATDNYVDIDLNIMQHINKLLLNDWRQPWESKIRISGEEIDNKYDNWVDLADRSIESTEIQKELTDLIDWYKMNVSKVSTVVRIAVVVYRLLRIYPFLSMNKLTIVGIVDYLLYKNGYLMNTFIPASRAFDTYEDEFIDAWYNSIQSDIDGQGEEITNWIDKYSRNVISDVLDAKEQIEVKLNTVNKSIKQPFLDLNKRQLKILKYLQTIPTVKREDYVQMMNVSTMTAYRDLAELLDKRLLKTTGQGRGTKYMLSSR